MTVTALIGPVLAMLAGPGVASAQTSLPRCGPEPGAALPADCVLEAPPLTLGFEFTRSSDDPQRGTLTLTQSTPEGGTRDVSGPFEMAGALYPPALRDIANDEVPELLVHGLPDAVDLWTLAGDGFYRLAGRLAAGSPDLIEERGALIVGSVEAPDGQITETAYLLDGAEVVTLFRLRVDPATRTCRLIDPRDGTDDDGGAGLNAEVLLADCAAREWPDAEAEAATD